MAIDGRGHGGSIRCRAPAKVNLYLHVLNRRPDGYHDIDSLIVFADVFDEIEVSRANRLGLKLVGPFARQLEAVDRGANIVILAARALAESSGENEGVSLTLRKNLPVAAGLGGGSSDGAATLRALCKLWDLDVSESELQTIARRLGADVPACLVRSPVYVGGVGEIVSPAPALPDAWLLLVNPGVPLATAEVFRRHDPAWSVEARFQESPADAAAMTEVLSRRSNDLEDTAVRLAPQIAEVIGTLHALDGCLLSRMSGSGATCFGLFADGGAAKSAETEVAEAHPAWWVKAGRMLGPGTA
ncbi:MAG: 4-(cytidine 5'-diphospho)-2-C-methyl-D-erythritol kinase [Alphaproteobacteria bacterium]|nr:4-(cytidine 5'-diphospho)-2-C-methyl-D-erythritol kinase [Alphaproteobacteria bacterium]